MKNAEEKRIIESNIKAYLEDGLFKKGDYKYLTEFYLNTAKKTLLTADVLMQLSESTEQKQNFNLSDDFESFLWVITASYYSMFYAVNALFSNNGIKIGDKIAHKVASDVFYHFFIQNNKIADQMYEIYQDVKEQAMDLTASAEKMSDNLEFEKNKRHRFQYNMTETIKRNHAHTSLKRAKDFVNQIEMLIK